MVVARFMSPPLSARVGSVARASVDVARVVSLGGVQTPSRMRTSILGFRFMSSRRVTSEKTSSGFFSTYFSRLHFAGVSSVHNYSRAGTVVPTASIMVAAATDVASDAASSVSALPWYEAYSTVAPYTELISLAPLVFFAALQLSPLQATRAVEKAGNLGKLSAVPTIVLLTNCVTWFGYGVVMNDMTIMAANGAGAILCGYYTSVFARYNVQWVDEHGVTHYPVPMRSYVAGAGVVCAGAGGIGLGLPFEQSSNYLGLMGNAISLAFFASPLAQMSTVIKEKSTASMPFAVSACSMANCIAWTSYGMFVAHDLYVICPNAGGMVLSAGQLSLFVRYGFHDAAKDTTHPPLDQQVPAGGDPQADAEMGKKQT